MPKFIDRTGEKKMMNCGLEATIIRYGSNKDIDVQFEDGQAQKLFPFQERRDCATY